MDTPDPNVAVEKTLKILSVVLPRKLAHQARCSEAQAGLSVSQYLRRVIAAALATEIATVNSAGPTAVDPTPDEPIVAAAE